MLGTKVKQQYEDVEKVLSTICNYSLTTVVYVGSLELSSSLDQTTILASLRWVPQSSHYKSNMNIPIP